MLGVGWSGLTMNFETIDERDLRLEIIKKGD